MSRPRPPAGLTVSTVGTGAEEIAILSFPLATGAAAPSPLTPAESRVALALLAGKSNAEIARERSAAVRTVANQVASIYRKLGVQSRAELCARAALLGCAGTSDDDDGTP